MGVIVRECYRKHLDNGGDSCSILEFADEERRIYGKDVWAERVFDRIYGEVCIIDGCRSIEEVDSFRRFCDDIIIISIHASPSIRFERLVSRGREDAPKSSQDFDSKDRKELEWGIGDIIALSDIMIINETDKRSLELNIKDVLEHLGLF